MCLDSLYQNELRNPGLILSDITEKFSQWGSNETSCASLLNNEKKENEDFLVVTNRTNLGLYGGISLFDWESRDNLKLMNLSFDVTPVEFIDAVVSDVGMVPPSSVTGILRELHVDRISMD